MINVGFTGTQKGLTQKQKEKLSTIILMCGAQKYHHGDCLGADAEFHDIVLENSFKIKIHPPENPVKRAFKASEEIAEEKEYIARNHDIVDESKVMIVCPSGFTEVLRSGTWATYRYAKKKNKIILTIYPDGQTREENC